MQILFNKKTDINAQNKQYNNALQAALYKNYEKMIRLLLNYDVIVNWKNI